MAEMSGFVREWFQTNTFLPPWFPKALRHVASAFGFALVVQALAILITSLILDLAPDFSFRGAIILLGVICTALTVGGAPGLIASFSGTLLLEFFLIPPYFSLSLNKGSDLLSVVFYLLVCLSTNLAATYAGRLGRNFYSASAPPSRLTPTLTKQGRIKEIEQRLASLEGEQKALQMLISSQSREIQAKLSQSHREMVSRLSTMLDNDR